MGTNDLPTVHITSGESKTKEVELIQNTDFVNCRNQRLFQRQYKPTGPILGVIVFNHGYSHHIARWHTFLQGWCKKGYWVFAYDCHGHGKSEPKQPNHFFINDIMDLRRDQIDYINQVVLPTVGDLPIYLLGFSMGALTGCLSALKYQEDSCLPSQFKGIIMISAAMDAVRTPLLTFLEWIAYFLNLFVPWLRLVDGAPLERCVKDPAIQKSALEDPLMDVGPVRVRTAYQMLQGFRYMQLNGSKLNVPLLALHGGEDTVTPVEPVRSLLNKCQHKDVTFKLIKEGWHEMAVDTHTAGTVVKCISDWLEKRSMKPK